MIRLVTSRGYFTGKVLYAPTYSQLCSSVMEPLLGFGVPIARMVWHGFANAGAEQKSRVRFRRFGVSSAGALLEALPF